jgi:hypothetical protein
MTYLHEDAPGVFHLDHRLTPEVRAMLCAMASRMPLGGIRARYDEIVLAVAEGIWDEVTTDKTWKEATSEENVDTFLPQIRHMKRRAEDRLTTYPLHPKVQVFFDKFVKMYGHSSILELTGSPSVYAEGISWYDAWLMFDNPLVAGQEFSTRAVRHKDWPMARACYTGVRKHTPVDMGSSGVADFYLDTPHPDLKELHDDWFEVFEAEVDWWKDYLSVAANREALGIADKEPFRPALDRARWAIPGTIATGCAHTGNLRVMARVLQVGSLLAQRGKAEMPIKTWEAITEGYRKAVPGLAEMGLREAVYGESTRLPAHVFIKDVPSAREVRLRILPSQYTPPLDPLIKPRPAGERSYLDPSLNQHLQVEVTFQCSLAVARDWHRHRTMYPWTLDLVRDHKGPKVAEGAATGMVLAPLQLHSAYEPKSDLAKEKVPDLLQRSSEVYDTFMARDNQMQAVLALPLGTRVQMRGQGGLRDMVYMLELREYAEGANFEYKAQAHDAANQLRSQLEVTLRRTEERYSLSALVGI